MERDGPGAGRGRRGRGQWLQGNPGTSPSSHVYDAFAGAYAEAQAAAAAAQQAPQPSRAALVSANTSLWGYATWRLRRYNARTGGNDVTQFVEGLLDVPGRLMAGLAATARRFAQNTWDAFCSDRHLYNPLSAVAEGAWQTFVTPVVARVRAHYALYRQAGAGVGEAAVLTGVMGVADLTGVRSLYEAFQGESVLTGAPLTMRQRGLRFGMGGLQLAGTALGVRAGIKYLRGRLASRTARRMALSRGLSRGAQLRAKYAAQFGEYSRFRSQGFTPAQSKYLTQPYRGVGHHFVGRRHGLPSVISESPLNVMKPKGISIGRFYERHFMADPHFFAARFPRSVGGVWNGTAIGLQKPGLVGRLWYGSPGALKITVGAGAATGGGGALYWWRSSDED